MHMVSWNIINPCSKEFPQISLLSYMIGSMDEEEEEEDDFKLAQEHFSPPFNCLVLVLQATKWDVGPAGVGVGGIGKWVSETLKPWTEFLLGSQFSKTFLSHRHKLLKSHHHTIELYKKHDFVADQAHIMPFKVLNSTLYHTDQSNLTGSRHHRVLT